MSDADNNHRERPATLPGITQRLDTPHGKVYVNVNLDENDEPFEVFINVGASGGFTNSWAEGLGKTISNALRAGADPAEIADDLMGIRGPKLEYDNGDEIYSIPDAVGVALVRVLEGKPGESIRGQVANDSHGP